MEGPSGSRGLSGYTGRNLVPATIPIRIFQTGLFTCAPLFDLMVHPTIEVMKTLEIGLDVYGSRLQGTLYDVIS